MLQFMLQFIDVVNVAMIFKVLNTDSCENSQNLQFCMKLHSPKFLWSLILIEYGNWSDIL